MTLAEQTVLMLVITNGLGLAMSYALGRGWVPAGALLQPGRQDWQRFRGRLPLIALNISVLIGASWVALSLVGSHMPTSRPPLLIWAFQMLAVALVDDAWFYAVHRLLHVKPELYRRVHRVHHRAHAPLPLDYIYVHPLEWATGALGPIAGLILISAVTGGLNAWTFLGYSTLRQIHELNVHSGMRSPIASRLRFVGTAEQHDQHHARPSSGNYGTAFRFLDHLLGTASAGREPT